MTHRQPTSPKGSDPNSLRDTQTRKALIVVGFVLFVTLRSEWMREYWPDIVDSLVDRYAVNSGRLWWTPIVKEILLLVFQSILIIGQTNSRTAYAGVGRVILRTRIDNGLIAGIATMLLMNWVVSQSEQSTPFYGYLMFNSMIVTLSWLMIKKPTIAQRVISVIVIVGVLIMALMFPIAAQVQELPIPVRLQFAPLGALLIILGFEVGSRIFKHQHPDYPARWIDISSIVLTAITLAIGSVITFQGLIPIGYLWLFVAQAFGALIITVSVTALLVTGICSLLKTGVGYGFLAVGGELPDSGLFSLKQNLHKWFK